MNEAHRLAFIEQRDGIAGAVRFARQTRSIYRTSVLQNGKHGRKFHYASTRIYRRAFIESYLACKQYCTEHGARVNG